MSRWLACWTLFPIFAIGDFASGAAPDLHRDVLPVLKAHCVRCHGPAKQEGELNLSLPTAIARGGENGRPLNPDDWSASLLWKRVAADEMPPEAPVPREDKELLRQWIEAGAPGLPAEVPAKPDGDEHWAYQPLRPIPPPSVGDASRLRTSLDAFVQARLEAVGLTLAPETDRETLIRRVAFDLTGLPPTPEEIDKFLSDDSERAYESLVERYLASPHYGERWGKFWLDAAGYADSNGYFNADTDRPLAFRYRDWVVDAINADQPFDQFVREQLAGDELAGYSTGEEITQEMLPLLTATHFLRNSPDGTDSSDGNDDERRADKYAVLEGTMQIMGSSLFGLTTQCARCHDHKFEPFKQRDYYQLQAVLYPAFHVENWSYPKDRHLPAATSDAVRAWEARAREVETRIAAERASFEAWRREKQPRGQILFQDRFDDATSPLSATWSNSAPGDRAPAGQPGVNLDSSNAPGALPDAGRLRIVESGDEGDRAFSTRQAFDWTPDACGGWIQATFDLVEAEDETPYVAYFLALRDFNDVGESAGGNVLIDGARDGKATVHVDYPGADSRTLGRIGDSEYVPGSNFGVRVTNRGDGKFELAQLVNGVPEAEVLTLAAADLPDGGFGFEYCCGRSFSIDNVRIETNDGSPDGVAAEMSFAAEQMGRQQLLTESIAALESQRGEPLGQLAFAADLAPAPPRTPLLERGDYKSPLEWVDAAAPAMISEPANPADLNGLASERSTGRRLAFAQWLTRPDSRAAALLARVTVNRWWAHHFGVGIVATPENVGYSGAPPTHPELLEFLAAELVRNGWSAKELHRLILHSAVYRQTSRAESLGARLDPNAQLLSRFPLRRLDAESIRDAMLAVSGELDRARGGPYVPTDRAEDGDVVVQPTAGGGTRRSIYLQQRRSQVLGLLDVFDAPSLVTNCTQRVQTTIPLQSLKLLNSEFVRDRAAALARRTANASGADQSSRLWRLYRLAIGRAPTDAELRSSMEFLTRQPLDYADQAHAEELAWTDLCQALLASNAFLYVQ